MQNKRISMALLVAFLVFLFGGLAGCTQGHVESITILEGSFREEYALDAQLNLEKASISVKTSKGNRTEPITLDMVGGFDASTVGERTLTVYYGGKTANFTYRVTHSLPIHSSMRLTAELNGQTLTVQVNRPDYPIWGLDFTVIATGKVTLEAPSNFTKKSLYQPDGSTRVRVVLIADTTPVEKECIVATIRGNFTSVAIENASFSDGNQDYIVPNYSADK